MDKAKSITVLPRAIQVTNDGFTNDAQQDPSTMVKHTTLWSGKRRLFQPLATSAMQEGNASFTWKEVFLYREGIPLLFSTNDSILEDGQMIVWMHLDETWAQAAFHRSQCETHHGFNK